MAAVAADLRYVLIVRVSAMIAAVLLVAADRTRAPVVSAPVVIIIRHIDLPGSTEFCPTKKNREPERSGIIQLEQYENYKQRPAAEQ
jgi:hypothetical protein